MYKLIVKNKGVTIIDKTLSQDECESIKTTGVQWICDAFMKYVGLDINDYSIKEYRNGKDYFTIYSINNIQKNEKILFNKNRK